jgi:hypothetical protein
MPKKMNKFSGSIRPTTVRTNNLRQAIRKCPTLAFPVQTSPAAHLHPHHHGGALRREVLKMTDIPAVPACRLFVTFRTGAYSRPYGRDHPAFAVPLHSNNPRARPRSPICVFSHTLGYRQGRRSVQTARKVRQTATKWLPTPASAHCDGLPELRGMCALGKHPLIEGWDERERCARKRSQADRTGCASSGLLRLRLGMCALPGVIRAKPRPHWTAVRIERPRRAGRLR